MVDVVEDTHRAGLGCEEDHHVVSLAHVSKQFSQTVACKKRHHWTTAGCCARYVFGTIWAGQRGRPLGWVPLLDRGNTVLHARLGYACMAPKPMTGIARFSACQNAYCGQNLGEDSRYCVSRSFE